MLHEIQWRQILAVAGPHLRNLMQWSVFAGANMQLYVCRKERAELKQTLEQTERFYSTERHKVPRK